MYYKICSTYHVICKEQKGPSGLDTISGEVLSAISLARPSLKEAGFQNEATHIAVEFEQGPVMHEFMQIIPVQQCFQVFIGLHPPSVNGSSFAAQAFLRRG